MDGRLEIESLLNEAYGLPYGHARIAVLERAIRIADKHQMIDLAFEARQAICDSASLSGKWELIPVHFPWLLATCDHHPDEFDEVGVVFEYLSALQSLPFFSKIEKQHILAAQVDLEHRFQKFGYELHEVRRIKFLNAIEMGDLDLGAELLEEMTIDWGIPSSNAQLADGSYAHQLYARGWFEILRGDVERGLRDLENVYDNRSPDSIIHGFSLAIALPHLLTRGTDDGKLRSLASRCEAEVRGRPEMIEPYSDLMQFWVRSEDFESVSRHFLEYATYGEQVQNELDRLGYFQTARFVVSRFAEASKFEDLNFPNIHPLPAQNRDPETLTADYKNRASLLAAAFDERNGNSFYGERFRASLAWTSREI